MTIFSSLVELYTAQTEAQTAVSPIYGLSCFMCFAVGLSEAVKLLSILCLQFSTSRSTYYFDVVSGIYACIISMNRTSTQ